jgi:riboflavin kinase/FMN adenylyltransferase
MRIIRDLARSAAGIDSVVTIGAFDGVHLGHQALICQLVARAQLLGCQAAVITFHPHPSEVLTSVGVAEPASHALPRYLTTAAEKAAILERLGVDLLAILAFTHQMANTQATDFLAQVCNALGMRELWVGPRFALGHDRQGDIPALRALGPVLGFELRVVDPLMSEGEVVTSSRIRELALAGRVREAAHLLGRFYNIVGEVVHGDHRGRLLGFSTANVEIQAERIVPSNGVYVGYAWVGEERYGTVMSIGVRPTFGDHERLLEVHLLDFDGDLYGTDLRVEFVERLRPEVNFDSVQTLITQLYKDKSQARGVLAAEDRAH